VKSNPFDRRWLQVFRPKEIAALAEKAGFCLRARKLTPFRFFLSLALGFHADPKRSVAGHARFFGVIAGETVSRQSMHGRLLTPEAAEFLKLCSLALLERSAREEREPLPKPLDQFEDVTLFDSSVITLANKLGRRFPACRKNVYSAALKIHTRMSLTTKQVETWRITSERVHDRKGVVVGDWAKDRLSLFDMGFADYGLFGDIQDHGGHFCTRLKDSANGTIVGVRNGCLKRDIGRKLNDVGISGRVVDLDVKFGAEASARIFRVVGIYNRKHHEYHWYVTSLPADEFSADLIAKIYTLRWQIELLFKEWKSVCRIDQLPSEKEPIIECLIYASLCASLLGRLALNAACQLKGVPWHQTSATLGTQVLALYAASLGTALLAPHRAGSKFIFMTFLERLIVMAKLPNGGNAITSLNVTNYREGKMTKNKAS
jgi:IS4 transposase